MTSKTIHDADALLLYRVGPVYCCSPTLPVESVIMPPHLTRPPGTTVSEPGMFKTPHGIVKAVNLRKRFGVDEKDWTTPGRIVVVEVEGGHAGMWVDEIVDVIQSPSKGWGGVPACIPKDVFTRTLLLDDVIQLYADFENIYKCKETGYLRQHIENLKAKEQSEKQTEKNKSDLLKTNHVDTKKSEPDISESKDNNIEIKQDEVNFKSEPEGTILVKPEPAIDVGDKIKSNSSRDIENKTSKTVTDKNPQPAQPGVSVTVKNKAEILPPLSKKEEPPVSFSNKAHNYSQSSPDHEKTSSVTNDLESRKESEVPEPDFFDHNPFVPENQRTKDKADDKKDESMTGYYVAIWIIVLVLGVYGIFLFSPSNNESTDRDFSSEKQSYIAEIKNKSETELVEIKKSDKEFNSEIFSDKKDEKIEPRKVIIKEAVKKESKVEESDTNKKYHAAIKKDNEGLVITLTQPEEESRFQGANIKKEVVEKLESSHSIADIASNKKVERDTVQAKETVVKKDSSISNKVIIHIVVKGDTLWHIAKRYINNPYRYPELARLSHIKNPDLIYPGNKVKIIYKKAGK